MWPFEFLNSSQMPASALLIAVLLVGAVSDWRTRRLPNWLTLGGAATGLVWQVATRGGPGALDSGLGWLLGCALLFIPFALRGMGAGDVKLLGAVGAIRGVDFVLIAFVYTALVGGVLALLVMARCGTLAPALRGVGEALRFTALALWRYHTLPGLSTLLPASSEGGGAAGKTPKLPYGVAIAAGSLLALVVG